MTAARLISLIAQGDRDGFAKALQSPRLRIFANAQTADGNLLHAVVRCGWGDMIAPLVDAGADPNGRDAHHETPLHLAAGMGKTESIGALIRAGADINARAGAPDSLMPPPGWGDTPLHRAIDAGDIAAISTLLDAGADPKAKTPPQSRGMNAWHRAALQENPAVMDLLLKHPEHAHMNDSCDSGKTQADTFRLALRAGHAAVVQRLIDHGVNINGRDAEGHAPLHWLIMNRKTRSEALPMIRLLLRHGADGDKAANHWGETPLMVSAKADFPEAMRLLLDTGADATRRSKSGETALHFAAHHYTVETIQLLLDAGADINARDKMGQTPLHIAAHHNRRDVVKTLLAEGADPHAADHRGRTPDMLCLAPVQQTTRALVLQAQQNPRAQSSSTDGRKKLRGRFARAQRRKPVKQWPPRKNPPSNGGGYRP